jgi:hypothetical protein
VHKAFHLVEARLACKAVGPAALADDTPRHLCNIGRLANWRVDSCKLLAPVARLGRRGCSIECGLGTSCSPVKSGVPR